MPAGINFFSPFSSLDLRLKKDFRLGEHIRLSLIGEGFNMFNETNIRGSSKTNYAGRNISIGPYQAAQNGQPAQTVQANFYSPVTTAGGFFGSGGPRPSSLPHALNFKLSTCQRRGCAISRVLCEMWDSLAPIPGYRLEWTRLKMKEIHIS